MTAAKSAVQRALYDLWYTHNTKEIPQSERNQLVKDFTEQWLGDWMKDELYKPVFRHPMTRLKQRFDRPLVTVSEILADFMIRADMTTERYAEYPVTHEEQEITNADNRKSYEVGIFTDELDEEADERVPYRYMSEAEIIERQAYVPADPVTVEQFRAELAHVKRYADFFADSFAEEYGYNRADALRRVKGLRLERVRECRICSGAFYAHDLRRENCDQQHGIKSGGRRTEMSACELIYQTIYQSEYYQKTVRNA